MEKTIEKLEDLTNVDLFKDEANQIIAKSAGKASAIAAIPVPLLDTAAIIYVQVKMVEQLAKTYNVEIEKQNKVIISATVSAIISKLLVELVNSLTAQSNLDKVLGESLVKASISGFITTVSGEVYQYHFANGGTIDDFTVETYITYFQEQIKSDRLSAESIMNGTIDKALAQFGVN